MTYVADENGFRAESPFLPTPPPLPAHAIEQIRFAEEERLRKAREEELNQNISFQQI